MNGASNCTSTATSTAATTTRKYRLKIDPPLRVPQVNAASPWASTLEQIKELYDSPFTGAVTTRTCLLEGFTHDDRVHQYIYLSPGSAVSANTPPGSISYYSSSSPFSSSSPSPSPAGEIRSLALEGAAATAATAATGVIPTGAEAVPTRSPGNKNSGSSSSSSMKTITNTRSAPTSTLNTLGYSPITLSEYLGHINEIVGQRHLGTSISTIKKPFILSVTGTPDEIALAYALIANAAEMDEDLRLAMEVNLSNDPTNSPDRASPPAYVDATLREYLEAIADSKSTYRGRMASDESVPRVGVKLPPYTHIGQFESVVAALADDKFVSSSHSGSGSGSDSGCSSSRRSSSVIDFITCTSALGSSLVLREDGLPALANQAGTGTGIGGLAGAAIHPLALGNVATFRRLLDQHPHTRDILIIGAGGVEDRSGAERMVQVGAGAVAVASAMGRYGVGVFEQIAKDNNNSACAYTAYTAYCRGSKYLL